MENNTPDLNLTDQEKHQLENYKGENEFIKSLSEKYKEYGKLTEKQLNAFRNQETKKPSLQRCPHTDLHLKQIAVFVENEKSSKIVINAIREKALCIFDEANNRFAWMPSKAVKVENQINSEFAEDGEDIDVMSLKSWFTPDKEFWKISKPIQAKLETATPPIKEESPQPVQTKFDKAVDQMYQDKDELPF